jgi:hydroxymethylglutaryl-CoA synthase
MLSASDSNLNVGIHAIELYIPSKFVSQEKLEEFDSVSKGKYTIGLGQDRMAVVDDLEDIQSICLTAVDNLMKKYQIDPKDVGRLEIGESNNQAEGTVCENLSFA